MLLFSAFSLDRYKKIFEIIDERRETQLHRPLHAAFPLIGIRKYSETYWIP
jgi:hypothetical protein